MELHFLAGLPRSGSTLLAAILNQNPAAKVSSTSELVNILDVLANLWAKAHTLSIRDPEVIKLSPDALATCKVAVGEAVPMPTLVPVSYTTDALTADVPLPLTK